EFRDGTRRCRKELRASCRKSADGAGCIPLPYLRRGCAGIIRRAIAQYDCTAFRSAAMTAKFLLEHDSRTGILNVRAEKLHPAMRRHKIADREYLLLGHPIAGEERS